MFLGHLGLGFAGKRLAPAVSLGTLFPLDYYDWSHSLLALAARGLFIGGLYFVFRGNRAGAVVLAAGVPSHWFLDVFVHRPDMPVLPRGPYVGLGLWGSLPLTVAAEDLVFGNGVAYRHRTVVGGAR